MPTVHLFSGCRIAIYADDHFPPHFHLIGPGWRCAVVIESLEMMAGEAPRKELREALDWAAANLDLLMRKWREFNERG